MPIISLTSVRVLRDTNEPESDEPYVIVNVVDLHDVRFGVTAPRVWTRIVGPWAGANKDSLLTPDSPLSVVANPLNQSKPQDFWDINGQDTAISSPDSVIILVAMMEHDESSIAFVRTLVDVAMTAAAAASVNNSALSRAGLVRELRAAMRDAIDGSTQLPIVNSDERLGDVQELRLTAQEVSPTASATIARQLTFEGDGGRYQVNFTIRR